MPDDTNRSAGFARSETEHPTGEQTPGKASPRQSAKRRPKDSPFSTAGRELSDDELYRIVGGL